jgi:hypothetical protein
MNHLSACKRQAVDTKRSQRDMNCETNQGKASFTTTATLDLIQDYQKKKDIEHIRKDMIPSPPLHQAMLKGSTSLPNSSGI